MGRRSRQSILKRVKEKKRQEKAALKSERRLARKQAKDTVAPEGELEAGADVTAGATETTDRDAEGIALVLVDLQNDFFSGGALAVPGADDVLPVANRLIEQFREAGRLIFATRDWHPELHCSFEAQGGPWPPHCVADTPGAEFHPGLRLPAGATVINKGSELDRDAYSGFQGTDMADRLRASGVNELVLCGLATDYCVKETALDGRREGFAVVVVQEGVRGVDVQPGDSVEALFEMENAGVRITTAGALIASWAT